MNLKEFNEIYVPVISLLVSMTGLISIILFVRQTKKENDWKKLQSSYNFIGIGEELELQERLYSVYQRLGIYSFPEKCLPMTTEQVQLIANDMEATLVTNMFLNYLQNICTAYSFDLVEEKVFHRIHESRICWWFTILSPYIEQRKTDYHNPQIWNEFTETAKRCMSGSVRVVKTGKRKEAVKA